MKLVFISDTHMQEPKLPEGDILIHSGDLTGHGFKSEVETVLKWLEKQTHNFERVLVTPGNHDFFFENNPDMAREMFENAAVDLLIHESVVINGVKFFGSPYTPWFFDFAYNRARTLEDAAQRQIPYILDDWYGIPKDVNVLFTHGPMQGLLDLTSRGVFAGCSSLLHIVNSLDQLKIHACGHIHEGHGYQWWNNKLLINASVLDVRYRGFNKIYSVDYDKMEISQFPEEGI